MDHDPVTGFLMYAGFHGSLARELSRGRRARRPLTLALVSVGGWEAYLAEKGPVAADRVIGEIAALLKDECRDFDTMGRYSPSIFSIIFPELDVVHGVMVVSRILGGVLKKAASVKGAESLELSAAVAGYPDDASTTDRLMEIAEASLLRAVEEKSGKVARWTEDV
ncbi:MAG TPA: GGDEF domain-containing protein [Proteobacteria bacterium]|nr:phytochrome-like protein cph2 [bacterium BMS3Abin14]HDL53873.1 GGDEF domain-containing protein [Pseudomonadota bacterium]